MSPLAHHAIAVQGESAQLTSCADDLVNWRSPSPLNATSSLDRGPLTTPKSLLACRATATPPPPPKQLSAPKYNPLQKQRGQHCRRCATGSLHTKHSWFGDHYHPKGAPRCPPIVPLPPLRNSSRTSETTVHSETNGQSQRTRCAQSHKIDPFLPPFYPTFTL